MGWSISVGNGNCAAAYPGLCQIALEPLCGSPIVKIIGKTAMLVKTKRDCEVDAA